MLFAQTALEAVLKGGVDGFISLLATPDTRSGSELMDRDKHVALQLSKNERIPRSLRVTAGLDAKELREAGKMGLLTQERRASRSVTLAVPQNRTTSTTHEGYRGGHGHLGMH